MQMQNKYSITTNTNTNTNTNTRAIRQTTCTASIYAKI